MTLPDTLFVGAAVHGSSKIRAKRPNYVLANGVDITSFHVVTDGECQEVEFFGAWDLLDAHPDGLVVARRLPYPAVQVIDWAWFDGP